MPNNNGEVEAVLRTCYECRGVAEGRRQNYTYTECGLKNIVLSDVLVYRCKRCGAESVVIPNMDGLHRTLALAVLCKRSLLASDEIRFLRKVAGFTATEFARALSVTKNALSRWENGGKPSKASDKSIRVTCGLAILEDIANERAGAVHPEDALDALETIRRFVTQFGAKNVLPNIQDTVDDSEKMVIDPEHPYQFSLLPTLVSSDSPVRILQ